MSRFSSTVRMPKIFRPSGTCVMPRCTMTSAGSRSSDSPRRRTEPARGRRSPEIVFSSVDLPAPFRPINATISPGSTVSVTPFRAWISP